MKISWTQNLEEQNQRDIRRNFKESLVVRKRLRELCLKKITENKNSKLNKLGYDSPSWALYQADCNGYQRALEEIMELIM